MTCSKTMKMMNASASIAIYLIAAAYLKFTYSPVHPPAGAILQLVPPFEKFYDSRVAFVVRAPGLDAFSDTIDQPERSNYVIYEGDRPLGPAHSQHTDISEIGEGRFSHWNSEGFVFSTSDNSDPRTTGRRYWVVLPTALSRE